MVKINLTAACSWADIGSLLFFFYLSILKRSMVPCFGLPQKRGDSLNNRFKTDTSHFSSFALNFSFQRVQTCYREGDFRKQVEDCGEERCLRSIGTPFTLYPQHRLHFNPEQEVSLFSFRYVAVKKILRKAMACSNFVPSLTH